MPRALIDGLGSSGGDGVSRSACPFSSAWQNFRGTGKLSPLHFGGRAAHEGGGQETSSKTGDCKIHSFYGASECGGICYDLMKRQTIPPGYVGPPLRNVAVRMEDEGPSQVSGAQPGGRLRVLHPGRSDENLRDGMFRPSDLLERNGDGYRPSRTDFGFDQCRWPEGQSQRGRTGACESRRTCARRSCSACPPAPEGRKWPPVSRARRPRTNCGSFALATCPPGRCPDDGSSGKKSRSTRGERSAGRIFVRDWNDLNATAEAKGQNRKEMGFGPAACRYEHFAGGAVRSLERRRILSFFPARQTASQSR